MGTRGTRCTCLPPPLSAPPQTHPLPAALLLCSAGRLVLRAAMLHPGIEVVAVNDPFVDAGERLLWSFLPLLVPPLGAVQPVHCSACCPLRSQPTTQLARLGHAPPTHSSREPHVPCFLRPRLLHRPSWAAPFPQTQTQHRTALSPTPSTAPPSPPNSV